MPYPEELVAPMRADLTQVGFTELKNTADVANTFADSKGTMLVVINSVCGCAAGAARPGVKMSLDGGKRPDRLVTVFAGQDTEATAEVRKHTLPYPPSSPAIGLYKDGKLIHFIERHQIEGRNAMIIAEHLKSVFEEVC